MSRNLVRQSWLPRFVRGIVIVALLFGGGVYAWTLTPSYSLYRIKRALEAHDYDTFSRYVDVDSVLDHALEELGEIKEKNDGETAPRGLLGKLSRKGVFKLLSSEAREVAKVGLAMVVEQAVKDRDHSLPQIPAFAVVGALWLGHTEGDTLNFPVKVKKGKWIEVRTRQTPEGIWRVVEVSNLPALLPALQRRLSAEQPDHE